LVELGFSKCARDIYSYLMPNMQNAAVAKVDGVFGVAINKRS
jgi:hypothetical protein